MDISYEVKNKYIEYIIVESPSITKKEITSDDHREILDYLRKMQRKIAGYYIVLKIAENYYLMPQRGPGKLEYLDSDLRKVEEELLYLLRISR